MDRDCSVSTPSRGILSWSSFSFVMVIKQNCWTDAQNFAWALMMSLHTSLPEWCFVYLSRCPHVQLTYEPSPRKPRLLHMHVVRMNLSKVVDQISHLIFCYQLVPCPSRHRVLVELRYDFFPLSQSTAFSRG